MKKILILPIFLLLTFYSIAQISDDFSDGDFTNNPEWLGNTNRFQINTNELQLNDVNYESPVSNLYILAPTQGLATWEFYVRLDFNPSASNYTRIYLNADQPDFAGSLNGYFVLVGGTDDVVELRSQTGTSTTAVISSAVGTVATTPAIKVRVTRDATNNWELLVDYAGGTNFVSQGTATDATHPQGTYFGVRCNYTTTRKDKFFFDDFYVNPIFTDNIPPTINSIEVISDNQILVVFDEPLDPTSAGNAGNFSISGGISIATAALDPSNPSAVILDLSTPLTNLSSYDVTSTVSDISGNASTGTTQSFTYAVGEAAIPFDILINEFMADPSPVVGLPDAEFVELYNRTTSKVFDLADYELSSGSTPQAMPEYLLLPGEYVVITDDSNLSLFTAQGITNVVAVSSFNALTNGGDNITIVDLGGTIINSVDYDDAWYQDAIKDDGGWTLELINPENLCVVPSDNWIASNDVLGGTPGTQNSVYDISNTVNLQLSSASVDENGMITVTFSNTVDPTSAMDMTNYTVDNGIGNPSSVNLVAPNVVELTFGTSFGFNILYTLTATDISDCVSINTIDLNNNSATFQLYEPAAQYDIIINELLPDPSPALGLPEVEFVEIYNRSDKTINLENFTFWSGTSSSDPLPAVILEPGDYIVVYKDTPGVNFNDFGPSIALESMVSMSNSGDDISLQSNLGTVIDAVEYNISWYNDTSKDDGGWTLERINPSAPCDGAENWSASTSLFGGTPSQVNSIVDDQVDDNFPDIISAFPTDPMTITAFFTEALDPITASNANSYSIDGNIDIASVSINAPENNSVTIILNTSLIPSTVYQLTIASAVTDCIGNPFGMNNTVSFALPEEIEEGDVVINEILADPLVGGVDFLELYNNSNKIVNIGDLNIINDVAGSASANIEVDYLLFPQSYVVLTENPADIIEKYNVPNPDLLLQNDLPTFSADEGNVTLFTLGRIIDKLDYNENFHFELIDETKGVSLERIDFDEFTNSRSNWHSAASSVGYATPTYQNSQYIAGAASDDIFTFADNTFSPDSDGYKDILRLDYLVPTTGYTVNIKVYDAKGRMVKDLVENELLAANGFYQWDGTNDNGEKARVGIYILWIELFDTNGNVDIYKKTCVLAGQF